MTLAKKGFLLAIGGMILVGLGNHFELVAAVVLGILVIAAGISVAASK